MNIFKTLVMLALSTTAMAQVVMVSDHAQVTLLRNGYLLQVSGAAAQELQQIANSQFGTTEVQRNGCLIRNVESDSVANCRFPLISCRSLENCSMTVYDTGFSDEIRTAHMIGKKGVNLILNRQLELRPLRQNGQFFKNLVISSNPNGGEGSGPATDLVVFDILHDNLK